MPGPAGCARPRSRSTRSWDTGALGEERLGHRLSELCADSLLVLHDRRIPRTRANIDHVAVTPTGIWVIDAKLYPRLQADGPLNAASIAEIHRHLAGPLPPA